MRIHREINALLCCEQNHKQRQDTSDTADSRGIERLPTSEDSGISDETGGAGRACEEALQSETLPDRQKVSFAEGGRDHCSLHTWWNYERSPNIVSMVKYLVIC